jgi:hypothetical protein
MLIGQDKAFGKMAIFISQSESMLYWGQQKEVLVGLSAQILPFLVQKWHRKTVNKAKNRWDFMKSPSVQKNN